MPPDSWILTERHCNKSLLERHKPTVPVVCDCAGAVAARCGKRVVVRTTGAGSSGGHGTDPPNPPLHPTAAGQVEVLRQTKRRA